MTPDPCAPHSAATLHAWKVWRGSHPLWHSPIYGPCAKGVALGLTLIAGPAMAPPPSFPGVGGFPSPYAAECCIAGSGFGSAFPVLMPGFGGALVFPPLSGVSAFPPIASGAVPAGAPTVTALSPGFPPIVTPEARAPPPGSTPNTTPGGTPVNTPEPGTLAVLAIGAAAAIATRRAHG